MIVTKTRKNGKKVISSDYFDNVKMYRDDIKDVFTSLGTGAARYHRKREDVERANEVRLHNVVQQMINSKLGCIEVSEYVQQYKGDLTNIIPDYGPSEPAEDYDEMKAELDKINAMQSFQKTEADISRANELTKKIKEWDDFVERELAKCSNKRDDDHD